MQISQMITFVRIVMKLVNNNQMAQNKYALYVIDINIK